MKLKVCGMKLNTREVAELKPDYLGFIFWKPSSRFFKGEIPSLPPRIKKVGVFVDATVEDVLRKIEKYDLHAVQLHGKESPEFCEELRVKSSELKFIEIIKVFSLKDYFDFSILEPYEEFCDYFMFDTKGKLPGGNGYAFDWSILKNYPSTKPFFLSGGIGLEDVVPLKDFMQSPASKYCHVVDVNSRFEIEPGLKNIGDLQEFTKKTGLLAL